MARGYFKIKDKEAAEPLDEASIGMMLCQTMGTFTGQIFLMLQLQNELQACQCEGLAQERTRSALSQTDTVLGGGAAPQQKSTAGQGAETETAGGVGERSKELAQQVRNDMGGTTVLSEGTHVRRWAHCAPDQKSGRALSTPLDLRCQSTCVWCPASHARVHTSQYTGGFVHPDPGRQVPEQVVMLVDPSCLHVTLAITFSYTFCSVTG